MALKRSFNHLNSFRPFKCTRQNSRFEPWISKTVLSTPVFTSGLSKTTHAAPLQDGSEPSLSSSDCMLADASDECEVCACHRSCFEPCSGLATILLNMFPFIWKASAPAGYLCSGWINILHNFSLCPLTVLHSSNSGFCVLTWKAQSVKSSTLT